MRAGEGVTAHKKPNCANDAGPFLPSSQRQGARSNIDADPWHTGQDRHVISRFGGHVRFHATMGALVSALPGPSTTGKK